MEEMHFGRAADSLHIAQPPLSQAIRKIESELGVQLLHRTSRVVTPTAAGRAFAKDAADVLASFDLAVAETRRLAGLGEIVRIGSIPNLSLERLQAFLSALSEREPSVHAHVTHLYSGEQIRRLHRGELDVGIFPGAGPLSGLETEPLFAGERIAAFLPRTHPLAARSALVPDDLRDEVLVTFPRRGNPPLHDWLLSTLADVGFSFADVHEVSSMNTRDLVLAVADGFGVAVGGASLVLLSEAGMLVSCCPLEPAASMPDTVLAWSRQPARHLEGVLPGVRDVARMQREGDGAEPAAQDPAIGG
jgi:DNA-binding transcriptional LysR family regulator